MFTLFTDWTAGPDVNRLDSPQVRRAAIIFSFVITLTVALLQQLP